MSLKEKGSDADKANEPSSVCNQADTLAQDVCLGKDIPAAAAIALHPELAERAAKELARLTAEAAVQKATPGPYTRIDKSDQGNANLLIHQVCGDLRYAVETERWLRWTGTRWQVDEHETFANGCALEVAERYTREAQQLENSNQTESAKSTRHWALKCRNKGGLEAMLALARKSPGVPISVNELDRDRLLLGVENGVVDLRTGTMKIEAREDLVTRRCSVGYNPAALAVRWERFIEEITGQPIPPDYDAVGIVVPETVGRFTPRPALARYLKKKLGYALTGLTNEQKMFIELGDGSNGKNVLLDAINRVMGDYGVVLSADVLMSTARPADPERPTPSIAKLAGARFVLSSETRDGAKLDTNLIKAHTGDAKLSARRLHENSFDFAITHKLFLMTNNAPVLDHIDPAVRGRLHAVPFDRRWNRPGEFERDPALPDGDKTLKDQLAAEDEGILRWLIEGALLYQREGLEPPPEVIAFTHQYVREQDCLGKWLETLQRCPPKQGSLSSELFNDFTKWCSEQKVADHRTQKAFGTELQRRGIAKYVGEKGSYYGVRSTGAAAAEWEDKSGVSASKTDNGAPSNGAHTYAVPPPTPAAKATNGANGKTPEQALVEQFGVPPEDAAKLLPDFTTAEKIARASEGELKTRGIHPVSVKRLQRRANDVLKQQRAAQMGRTEHVC